jgi:hypothetical protein
VLHVRCNKLQELVTASEEQILRQADTIRRLEYYVDPDSTSNAHMQLAQAQKLLQEQHQELFAKVQHLDLHKLASQPMFLLPPPVLLSQS